MFQRVFLNVGNARVVGNLYRPAGAAPFPAVVVGGPMTSVKEQVTGVYASALAQRGIAALALDHRHYGESDGTPRQYEHHQHKIEDLRAALQWLATQPFINASKLGAAGVCLGVGYSAWAAVDNPLVKAFGGVVGYYRDPDAMRQSDPAGFQSKIEQGIQARLHYEATGEVITVPAAAREGDAAMTTEDTVNYYGTSRAAVPNYHNVFAVMSREHFLPFNVQAAAPRIVVPMLMVHSENALSPAWARKFFANLGGPKSELWLTAKSQTEFYDSPELVSTATDALAEHFHAHL
jgi:fermentation-respiration switch protein FrsA (DUF1100 family)